MRWTVLPLGMLVVAAGMPTAGASEQAVVPLTPSAEQRIEMLGDAGDVQQVESIGEAEAQAVMAHEPPSSAGRAASTAAKIAAGVVGAAVSIGFMVASLLFF